MCWPASGVILRTTAWKIWALGQARLLEVTAQKRTVARYVLRFAGFFLLLYLCRPAQLPLFSAPSHYLLPSAHVLFFSPIRTVDQIRGASICATTTSSAALCKRLFSNALTPAEYEESKVVWLHYYRTQGSL
jgi:hypothetical protein